MHSSVPSATLSLPVYLVSRNGVRNTGGVERVVHLTMDDLMRHGNEVTLVDEIRVVPSFLRGGRLGQFVFPMLACLWLWLKRMSGNRFVTISNSSFTPFYPSDLLIVHGSAAGYIRALSGLRKRFIGMRLLSVFEGLSMRTAGCVVCVSEDIRELCIKMHGIPPEKCVVVHNGINASIFNPKPKFTGDTVRIGFAGRLEYGKGLPYLIEVAQWVAAQSKVSLVIATISEIPEALQGLPNVSIMGGVSPEDMAAFYDKIDIFILPSLFEGFELVTLEALASGVSVLGTEVGACKVFIKSGVPWVRKLPASAAELATVGTALFDTLRRSSDPDAMRAFIAEFFSTQRFCAQIRALALRRTP